LVPELKVLKYHYNHKIRALVQELSKNMNKIDYLEIEEFGMVDCKVINEAKMASLNQSLENE
jgi:demethoxyubiquinone hydroxylase (CLK1/Coq7/Cat5 family)